MKTGSVYWSALTALSYLYMVSAWGGYVFIINLIPLHVFFLLIMGRFSHRIYVGMDSIQTTIDSINNLVSFPPIDSVLNVFHFGSSLLNANPIRRLSTGAHQWTHGVRRSIPFAQRLRFSQIHPKLYHPIGNQNFFRERSDRQRRTCLLRGCSVDICGVYRSVERSLLFSLGHRLRQNSYSYNRVCVWAPANHLVLILLRLTSTDPHISHWFVVLHQRSQWRASLQ